MALSDKAIKDIVVFLAYMWITHLPPIDDMGHIIVSPEFGNSFAKALAQVGNRTSIQHSVSDLTGQSIDALVRHCRLIAFAEDLMAYERLTVAPILRHIITFELDASVMAILIRYDIITLTVRLMTLKDSEERGLGLHFNIVCIWRLIFQAARDSPHLALEAMNLGIIPLLSLWSFEDSSLDERSKYRDECPPNFVLNVIMI